MDFFAIFFTELESANLFLCLSKLFLKCEKTCTTLVLKMPSIGLACQNVECEVPHVEPTKSNFCKYLFWNGKFCLYEASISTRLFTRAISISTR